MSAVESNAPLTKAKERVLLKVMLHLPRLKSEKLSFFAWYFP